MGLPREGGVGRTLANPVQAIVAFVRRRLAFIVVAGVFLVVGLGLAGAYATVVDTTNKLGFCANTCHEMHDTVYAEYQHSKHFKNEQGVVVACAQCHVPQNDWPGTLSHKVMASFELYNHFVLGESDPKVFEKRRFVLAQKVWAEFKETNAQACKNCHHYSNMALDEQRPSIRAQHTDAMKTDENCLDCHKGITHKKFEEASAPTVKTPGGGGDFDVQ